MTTNFDELVEEMYRPCNIRIRSLNHDLIKEYFPTIVEYHHLCTSMIDKIAGKLKFIKFQCRHLLCENHDCKICNDDDAICVKHIKSCRDKLNLYCELIEVQSKFVNLQVLIRDVTESYHQALYTSEYGDGIHSCITSHIFNDVVEWDERLDMKNHCQLKIFTKICHREYFKLMKQYNNKLN